MSGYIIANLRGMVDRFSRLYSDGVERPLRQNERGSLVTSVYEPALTNLNLEGRIFSASSAAGTGIVSLAAMPTTTATFALWNGNAVGSHTYLALLKASVWQTTAIAGVAPASFRLGLSPSPQAAAVSAYAGVVGPKSLSASTARTSAAIIGQNITLAAAPVWTQVAQLTAVAGDIGKGAMADLNGLFVIPPYHALGACILQTVTSTPVYGYEFVWAEIEVN